MDDLAHTAQRVQFGVFEVDFRAGELWRAGRKRKLSGQPFAVLAILLEHPGDVVSREELQKRLWPDTFVDVDHNLNTAINKIREALNDSSEQPRFIETFAPPRLSLHRSRHSGRSRGKRPARSASDRRAAATAARGERCGHFRGADKCVRRVERSQKIKMVVVASGGRRHSHRCLHPPSHISAAAGHGRHAVDAR
ncbi:MAG: winged helix-turn-helix domain-containing protein [Acidobacteriaceae bacterium]